MVWNVSSYNTNPNANTTINGIDIAELCSPAGYNDALRQIMADIATWIVTQGVSYPISIANGGTGTTTAPLALAALGGLAVKYRDLTVTSPGSSFTFADADRGCAKYYLGGTGTATIAPYSSVPIGLGGFIVVTNRGTGVLTVTRGSGVSLLKNGSITSSDAAIAVGGVATLIQWGTNDWTINGTGVS